MIKKDFSQGREQRIALIEGEEIDVTKIPTRVTIELSELSEEIKKSKGDNAISNVDNFNKIVDIISTACKTNKKITPDWLKDNTDITQLLDLMNFILEPIKQRAKAVGKTGDSSKNSDTPRESKSQE